MASDGTLYGTTGYLNFGPAQYGTVFKLTPPSTPGGNWIESTLVYRFIKT